MEIYTVTTDDENGTRVQVFLSNHDADQAAWDWLKGHWWSEHDGPLPNDLTKALTTQADSNPEYFIWYETHSVDDSPVIRSAKAEIDNLIDQIEQMRDMFDDSDGAIQNAIDGASEWKG